jgi:tryptophan-rich sensory protein
MRELFLFIGLALGGGFLSGFYGGMDKQWYNALQKPTWTPPSFVFGPVWTVLYILMGVASYLVYVKGGNTFLQVPLALYAAQSILNFLWTPTFFKKKDLHLSMITIVSLVGLLIPTIYSFYTVDKTAAMLMIPYLAWVCYAALLNIDIVRKNCMCAK